MSSYGQSCKPGFEGYLTADAYVAYERIGELWPGVFKTSCWVHGRRKFEACHHLGATNQTRTALSHFRKLFTQAARLSDIRGHTAVMERNLFATARGQTYRT